MSRQSSLITLAGRLIGVLFGTARASCELKPRKAIGWRVSWLCRPLYSAIGNLVTAAAIAFALLLSPATVTPAAAQNGGWNTPLGAGKGGSFSTPDEACYQQYLVYAPQERYLGITDTSVWYSKNCNWTTHFGTTLPAGTTFQCNSGYSRVTGALGGCVLANENDQQRHQIDPCTGINNGATPNPTTKYPIDILSGAKFFRATDFSTANGSLKLERFYQSISYGGSRFMSKMPYQIGGGWRFDFQNEVQFDTSGWKNGGYYLELETGDGGSFAFSYSTSSSSFQPYKPNDGITQTDYTLQFVGTWPSNPKTMLSGPTQWTVHDPQDRVWLFQTLLNPLSGYYDVAYPVSVTFRGGLTWTFTYGTYNQLTSVADSYGNTISFNWIIYNPSVNGLGGPSVPIAITSAALPDGTSIAYTSQSIYTVPGFSQPSAAILTAVQHLDSSNNVIDATTYLFENSTFPTYITGIVDSAGTRRWTVQYDTNGRATLSEEPSGIYATSVAYTNAGYPSFTRTVTNALGKSSVYNYHWQLADIYLQSIDGVASANCPASAKTYSYSSSLFLTSTTDEEGRVTNYSRNGQGLPTQIIDGYGTSSARTTSITWHPTYLVPTEVDQPNLKTNFTWNSSGQLTQVVQTDETTQTMPYSTNGQTRTWSYTYDTFGHLLTATGPLGTAETVTYTYNASGFLSSVTNEIGQVLTVSSVDARGQPTAVVDPNGVTTDLAYDLLDRLTTVTVNPGANQAVTSISYDIVGDITQVTRPNGDYLQYSWDNARRLTGVTDNLGNSIQYTRDNLAGVTARSIKDPNNTLDLSQTATYDELGRLLTFVGSAAQTWKYAYDRTDNRVSVTDPRSDVYQWAFDSLSRLISETNQDSSTVSLTRDGQDRVTAYKDPRSLTTSYVRDGFGDAIQRTSPDTGKTVYTYNALGEPTQITDGRGVVTNLSYDNSGRLLGKQYPANSAENVSYTWDSTAGGNYGVGRLTQITDASGSINWTYDAFGRITQEQKTTTGIAYTIGYSYDLENNVTQITYPSGRIVTYSRDSLGRISGVTTKQSSTSSAVTLATSVSYQPFGPLQSLWYGNGLDIWKTFTQDYLIDCLYISDTSTSPTTNDVSRCYGRTDNVNITNIWDNLNSNKSQSFWYTASNRLQNASGLWGSSTYYYDNVGNRTYDTETAGGGTTSVYGYPYNNNLLSNITQGSTTVRSFSYDGAGNITADNRGGTTYNYVYNNRNRLAELDIGSTVTADYTYDGLERLAIRTTQNMTPSGSTQYVYDLAGHLLAESDSSGTTLTEYIWFDDMPLALVANVDTSPNLYFVHVDHLNRPIMMTDANKSIVWQADYNPFGDVYAINGSATNNLRLPGQYFLIEDGLHYNWYRHYDPTIGRYIQPDPLGFVDGPSVYAYVSNNPLIATDPTGLFAFGVSVELSAILPTSGGGPGIFGYNFEYTSDAGWHLYKFGTPKNCDPIGFDVGFSASANFALGNGSWTGPFNNIVGNYGALAASAFYSPQGTGDWKGGSIGWSAGVPVGLGEAITNYSYAH